MVFNSGILLDENKDRIIIQSIYDSLDRYDNMVIDQLVSTALKSNMDVSHLADAIEANLEFTNSYREKVNKYFCDLLCQNKSLGE